MSGKRKRRGHQSSEAAGTINKKPKVDKAPSAAQFTKVPFVETPDGDERRREGTLYDLLGSEDEAERIAAAECVISCLLDGDAVPEPVLQRHLDRRLFRGLASGRNASRVGFSLVITEILGQLFGPKNLSKTKYPGLTFEKILGFLVDKTKPTGKVPGQEERDHFFGQLFGLECLVRSRIAFSPISRWQTVLDMLLKLGYKKVWLRSQCGWVIVQALEHLDKKQTEATLVRIASSGITRTPEGVAIWLVALNRFPDLKVKPWNHPLSNKSLNDLAAVLKESLKNQDEDKEERKNKQVNWTAQLHFVWDIILAHYAREDTTAEELGPFWSHVVDDGLFSKKATDGQKFKGFTVFQKMLGGLIQQRRKLTCLFSKNFSACLINQAAKEDRFLHRAATKTLNALESAVSSHPASLPAILECLLGKNGAYSFDQRTESKTIGKLLQNISSENEEECLDIIRRPVARLDQMEKNEAQSTVRTYIDYLSKALHNFEGTALGLLIKELASLAYSSKDIPDELLTEQIRDLCRTRLESSFAKLIRRSDDFGIFCQAVAAIDPGATSMESDIKTAVDEALARMNKLLKRKPDSDVEKSLTEALAVLHAVGVLQLYNEDPDAIEVLQDLQQLSQRVKKGKLDGAGSSELLVETLLSMVARPSSLMREVSQQVFEAFTSKISAEGLELLTGPLASGESTKGQQELFNADGDMDVDASSDEEDGSDADGDSNGNGFEIDSDVEFVDVDGEEENEGDDDDDDGDDEDEDEDGTDGGKPEPIDIDDIMGNILNSHRLDKDDDAESSEDEQDMSDSEMLALDDKLAEVIKQRVKDRPDAKKQKKEAKQSVINFKHRILDLLDIYVKKEPLNPLSFTLLVPLLTLMRTTSTKPLASRACGTILDYQKSLKKARSNKDEVPSIANAEDLMGTLLQVHEEASLDNAHAYAKAASAASLIIASTMCYVDPAAIKQVLAVYAKTQEERWLGKTKLQPSFFTDWNSWFMSTAS